MHLVNGTGNSPSPGRPTPGVVKQDKSSGGSVDTTKTRSDPQRVRMSSGERPIGAAKGKQPNTEALCQRPPPPLCDIPSGCCSFMGRWTVTRSSLRMLRWVAAFCRPLQPVLLLVSFPRSRSPVVGVMGLC